MGPIATARKETMKPWLAWVDTFIAAGCCVPCARHYAFAALGDRGVPRMRCAAKRHRDEASCADRGASAYQETQDA